MARYAAGACHGGPGVPETTDPAKTRGMQATHAAGAAGNTGTRPRSRDRAILSG